MWTAKEPFFLRVFLVSFEVHIPVDWQESLELDGREKDFFLVVCLRILSCN